VSLRRRPCGRKVEAYIAANPRIVSLIVTIGVPVIRERDGRLVLTRGSRVSISPAPAEGAPVVPLDRELIEKYAGTGWVDLRVSNFEKWKERSPASTPPDVDHHGSAALDVKGYPGDRFVPGDIVGWLLTNEPDEQGWWGGGCTSYIAAVTTSAQPCPS